MKTRRRRQTTKMATTADFILFVLLFAKFSVIQATKYCLEGYFCEKGHCCGHGRCCTYYYELWWFWVACVLLALMGTCWYFHQRRWKRRAMEEARLRTDLGDHFANQHNAHDPSKIFQLPTYEEIQVMPKEPPPYHQESTPLAVISSHHLQQAHTSRGYPHSPPLYTPDVMEPAIEPHQYSFQDTSLLLNRTRESSELPDVTALPSQEQSDAMGASVSASLLKSEERISN